MADDDRGFGSVALFLFGAALGAAAGVLLAPRSGKETREQLADWLKERREKGEELIGRVREESSVRKDAIVAAARAAKQAYAETSGKAHDNLHG